MALSSFGSEARSFAARVPDSLNLIAFDLTDFGDALTEAVARAYAARPFFVAPLIGNRRSAVALELVPSILKDQTKYWKRRESFEKLRSRALTIDGIDQARREALTKKEIDSVSDLCLVADSVVTRSFAELVQLADLVNFRPINSTRILPRPLVPPPRFRTHRGSQAIVVWAPGLDAHRAALFAFAFEELKTPVIVCCGDAAAGNALGLRARFVQYDDDREIEAILDVPSAVIDASPDDPATAIELAEAGLPIAASFTSGVYEYVDRVYLYDPWDFRSILHAGLSAVGGEPPLLRGAVPRPEALVTQSHHLLAPTIKSAPLVSVVMATKDRHGILPRAVASIADQTYPHIELVVANDGGKPIESLVAHLPRVTVINQAESTGGLDALIACLRAAKGAYVTGVSDDDYLFPDQISRLVYALERTGAAVATGMCSESYYERGSDSYDYIGTSLFAFRSTDLTVAMAQPFTLAFSSTLIRREAIEEVGYFDPEAGVYNDYDWLLRFLSRYDFLWVPRLLANYDSRLDASSRNRQLAPEQRLRQLRYVWSKFPFLDRPDIQNAREELLKHYAGIGGTPPPQRGVTRIREPRRGVLRLE